MRVGILETEQQCRTFSDRIPGDRCSLPGRLVDLGHQDHIVFGDYWSATSLRNAWPFRPYH